MFKAFQIAFLYLIFHQPLISQCTPNPGLYYPDGWGVIPEVESTIDTGKVGEPYSFTFYFRAPEKVQDVVDGGYVDDCPWYACGLDVDEVSVVNIQGVPSGLGYTCVPSSCSWETLEDGCVTVSGIPTTPTPNGQAQLVAITLEGRVTVGFITETQLYDMLFYIVVKPEDPPCTLDAEISATQESTPNAFDAQAIVSPFGGQAPYTYQWNTGSNSAQIFGLTANTYTVTVTDATNCEVIQSVGINTNTSPVDSCADFSVNFTIENQSISSSEDGFIFSNVTGGVPPYTFQWSNTQTTENIDALSSGSYTVTITDAINCEINTSVFVGLDSIADTNLCTDFNVTINNIVSESYPGAFDGAVALSLSGGSSPYQTTWSNGLNDPSIENLASGEYVFFITDANQCILSDTIFIDVLDSINPNACTLSLNFSKTDESALNANDGTVNVFASGGIGPYNYTWSNIQDSSDIFNLSPGIYSVTATDQNNCVAIDSVKIFAFGDTTCQLNITSSQIDQTSSNPPNGVASILVNGGVPPYQYQWSNGNTNSTVYDLENGSYFYTVTDANLCMVSDFIQIQPPVSNTKNIRSADVLPPLFYPNPTTGTLHLNMAEIQNQGFHSLDIYSLSGQHTYHSGTLNMNTGSPLSLQTKKGVYYIIFTSRDTSVTQKLLIF